MAAAVTTPFTLPRPSSSSSSSSAALHRPSSSMASRAGAAGATAVAPVSPHPTSNPATQLPNVDFNFEDLRQRMSAFTVKFDAFIERGQKRVLEERNEFRGRLGELAEDQRLKSQSIASLSSATSTHRSLLGREQGEMDEMDAAIRSVEATQAAHLQTRDRLLSQIASTRRQIESKLQAQRDYSARLEGQSRLNGPELAFWETYLGVRLEGAGVEERIRVIFTFEGGRGAVSGSGSASGSARDDREVWFDLDLSRRDYEVKGLGGVLEGVDLGHRLDAVVDRLNESRDIGLFLAGMRALFLEELNA